MKTLIVYYSLEGNTQYAAERIAGRIGADVLRLVPKKAYHDKGFAKFFWGGKSAVMGEIVCAQCHGYIKNICPECGCENLPTVTICAKCHAQLDRPKKL